ncbi:MAG: hypothetical protein JWR85_134 [Marmoricola sp.]|nr:hypothetical protein [Marmoricola sp.]
MTHPRFGNHPVFVDSRGSLLSVEFPDVPFVVRRAFVVTGPPGGADRGDHPVPCGQAVVLISGSATFVVIAPDGALPAEFGLDEPGQTVVLRRGEYVRYRLHDEHSQILVLAEDAYSGGVT